MSKATIQPDLMYRLLVQGVQDYAIYLLDADGVVLNWNLGAQRAKGYTAEEIVGRNYECFYSPQDRAEGVPQRNLELALRDGHYTTEGWRYRKDGSAFWAGVALDAIYDDELFVGFSKVTRDLTEQRASAQRFRYQALHDALTGLFNRTGLAASLEEELPKIADGSPIACHYIDLDRFKPVNDSFGHEIGDQVLQEVAARLVVVAGEVNRVARLGGDEFALVQLGSPSPDAVRRMANAIVRILNRPIRRGGKVANIGASVGVAVAPRDGADLASLVRNADMALYRAKEEGGTCVRFFDPSMSEKVLARSLLELKLRHAVEAKDFQLVYQPVVDGRTGRAIGFEALLRWTDQTGVPVAPAVFIPVAEEMGLMNRLGAWVLRTACQEAASWAHDITICVNVSAIQLRDPGLVGLVGRVLAETGLAPERLELEITETAVLADLENVRSSLERLRGIGVGIALDDFGTGFSSLSLVRQLPLTRIKIDRSFVSDIDGESGSTAVVEAVMALCRGYGLAITGEGVETVRQRDTLLAKGCHDLQGYLTGRPAPAADWRHRMPERLAKEPPEKLDRRQ